MRAVTAIIFGLEISVGVFDHAYFGWSRDREYGFFSFKLPPLFQINWVPGFGQFMPLTISFFGLSLIRLFRRLEG